MKKTLLILVCCASVNSALLSAEKKYTFMPYPAGPEPVEPGATSAVAGTIHAQPAAPGVPQFGAQPVGAPPGAPSIGVEAGATPADPTEPLQPAQPGIAGSGSGDTELAPGQTRPAPRPRTRLQLSKKPTEEEPATNMFNFPAVDLNTFLNFYAELVGRTILRPANLPAPLITLKTQTPLTRTEAIQAFDTVLAMNGITTIPVGEKFVKVVPVAQAAQEAARFSELAPEELPEAAQYTTHVVQLNYVRPQEVMPVLQQFAKIPNSVFAIEGSQILVIRDYAENVKRMLELIQQIDVAVPAEFVFEVIPIKYALASDIASALASLSTGGGSATVGAAGPSGAGRPAATRGPSGRLGARMGMTTPGMPMTPQPTPMAGATPGAAPGAQPSFSDRLRQIIQRAATAGDIQILGTMKIIADERSNSLLVFASREDMKTIKDIVAKLDTVQPQVLIEALILEVDLTDSRSFGVSWLMRPQQINKFGHSGVIQNEPTLPGLGTNGLSKIAAGLSWWGRYPGDFDVAVQAAANDSRAHILSRPHVVTTHANPATIQIGGTRPYPTGSAYGWGYGSYNTIQQLFIGITLDVLPLINPDGLVVMDIQQTIDSVGEMVDIANVGKVPSTISRSANAKIAVRDGETIMLGGFITEDLKRSDQGVPILKDIPLLGYLFKSTSRSTDRRELIVLIRPKVLPTPEAAAAETARRTESMPLTREAEVEHLQRESKLQREAAARRAKTEAAMPVFKDIELDTKAKPHTN
ncbi:MAG: hypothetical protein N2379_09565 [Verrucomicrobiae bacterium]|nr:hypothetical protein [Verrucomicrobiae bacterium]